MGLSPGAARGMAAAAALLLACAGSWGQGVNLFPTPGMDETGEREMKALAEAYPDRISAVAHRNGDWAVEMEGQWFFWAHGRVLPESQRGEWQRYARYRFYPYTVGATLPPLPELDAGTVIRLQNILREAKLHPPDRSEDFLEQLWGMSTRRQAQRHMVTVDFLRFHVRVNRRIAAALRRVAAGCTDLRRTDPQAAFFFAHLYAIDGYNYRDVADTRSLSYHSFGLAMDFIPYTYGGKAVYWLWSMNRQGLTSTWWDTPYNRRWMVPLSIVQVFEKHGFVWGGKWFFFDNMHFEYRPEILILAQEGQG